MRNVAESMARDLDILPNMRSLMWEGDPEFSTLFMHERVTHFTFGLDEYMEPVTMPTAITFPEISCLTPNITHLAIRINVSMAAIEPEVVELLKTLPRIAIGERRTSPIPIYNYDHRQYDEDKILPSRFYGAQHN